MEYIKTKALTFDETFNIKALRMSDENTRKNIKRKAILKEWDKNQEKNAKKLLRQIREGRYKISHYHTINVMLEKPRTLALLPHKDRIFQDMLLRSMKTCFDKVFIDHSYACIKNRGTTKCITDIQKTLKNDPENTKYYVQLDIKKYFPSVDNNILKELIRKTVKDEKLLKYHDDLIDSYQGLPIGNSTSQYYANLFISYVLHELLSIFNEHKIHLFVYMDDIIILSGNKKYLEEIVKWVKEEFSKINLTLKNPNAQVYVVRKNGIRFLGFILYGHKTLIRKNVRDKCWKLVKQFCEGKISKEQFSKSYCTYSGMFKYADTRGLCKQLYNYILEHTGEKFYFNNWNGKPAKISEFKGKNVKIVDITSFYKKYRIDFIYKGEPYRIITKSKKLINTLRNKNRPFDFVF